MLLSIILILTLIVTHILPWWSACILAFIASLWLGKRSGQSFSAGFGGMALAWIAMALFATFPNQHILAMRVAQLFHVYHWLALVAITGLIGGLAGGFSAMSGFLVRRAFVKEKDGRV